MWQSIVELLLPLVLGCDIYLVTESGKYQELDLAHYKEASYLSVDHLAIALSDKTLAPYETKIGIENMAQKIKSSTSIKAIVQINRTGPFYGYYVRVDKT